MQTFDFPFHSAPEVTYPDDQQRVKLGRGYTLAVQPFGPLERVLKLKLKGMRYFTNEAGLLVADIEPQLNAYALDRFYHTHRLHAEFIYPWDGRGDLTVRFNKPLILPEPEGSGMGALPEILIELIEVPQ